MINILAIIYGIDRIYKNYWCLHDISFFYNNNIPKLNPLNLYICNMFLILEEQFGLINLTFFASLIILSQTLIII